MGTICGRHGIGVAPFAHWMACKGCTATNCMEAGLLACGEYILCPTLPDGSSPNCSLAPGVVCNSWGGDGGGTFYNDVIAAWRIAGIVPVFSIGNSGPACGTAGSPGDSGAVIGVGSLMKRELSRFSSRGPTQDGRVKPDLSAPGDLILSAWSTGDDDYNVISGTSMACPHVVGAVAILLARNPNLTFDEVREALLEGVGRELPSYSQSCGGEGDDSWPNNYYGHGSLRVEQSLEVVSGGNKG